MCLPPCHILLQFYVEEISGVKYLSAHLYQRSADTFLGLPFNIMSYSILVHIIAIKSSMVAKELIISLGDAHIYSNHIDQVNTQLKRLPRAYPKIIINKKIKNKCLKTISENDFKIIGYFPHDEIKAPMAV